MTHDHPVVPTSGPPSAGANGEFQEWLVADGELGDLIRRTDWSNTPFGPRERWPQSLRTAVSLVVSNAFPMALLWTPDLLLLYNDAYRAIAGDRHPTALGRRFRDVWPERWNVSQPILAAVLERGDTACVQDSRLPVKRVRSEQDAYFTSCCCPVRVEDGTIGGVLVIVQETTLAVERQRAETERLLAALGDSQVRESRLGRIFESSPIDMAIIGLDGRFLDVNKAALDLHGFASRQEVIGRNCLDFVAPEHRAKVAEAWQQALREGAVHDVELVELRRDGRRFTTLVSAVRLDDATGQPYALLAMVRDVSEARAAQEAVRARDERLRVATEAAALGIYDFNPVTGEHHWDARVREFWGIDADEPITWDTLASAMHPDDRAAFEAANAGALDPRGDGVYACQYRVRNRRDGAERWLSAIGHATFAGGRAVRLIGTVQDITDRKQIEAALAESRERFTYAVSAAREGVWDWNMETDEVWYSPRYKEMLGYSEEEVEHHLSAWLRLVHPDDKQRSLDVVDAVMRGERDYEIEFRMRHKDGRYLDILSRGFPIRRAADGKIVRIVGIHLDLTDRKRAEAELQDSRNKYQALIETTNDFTWEVDTRGRYTYCSPQMETLWGIKPTDMVGLTPFDVMPAADRDGAATWFGEVVSSARPFRDLQTAAYDAHGGLIYIETSGVPFFDSRGALLGFRGVTRDVTERRRAAEALQEANAALAEANRHKDEFLAMLAHELRNPLAVIGNASLVLENTDRDGAEAQRARGAIARQAQHMGRLIDDLLDVSRVTQGKIGLRLERTDVARIVMDAVEASRPFVQSRGHDIVVSLLREPLALHVDPVRMTQAIANLLHNAAKFTPPGGRIHLITQRADDRIEIRVRDNGMGIDPALMPRIFDLFVQGDRSPDREQGGLGIGLTMARSLVEAQGGTIVARSDGPGTGSEFTVSMPLATEAAPAAAPTPVPFGQIRARRVLVVDDNADAREMMRLLIQMEGHEILVAGDGPAAIEAALRWQPDVALIDLGMPGMDGFEVARRMRAEPSLARTVLVALTGYGQEEDVQRSREARFDYHITKSADFEPVRQLLASIAVRSERAPT